MTKQLNLLCNMCQSGCGNICCAGYNPDTCTKFTQAYECAGGLMHELPLTKETCQECARSCTGCMRMRVAYGFVKKEAVAHLL